MAVDLHNRNQLLPDSRYFTEPNDNNNIKPMTKNYSSCFSSSDFGSVFSSPIESEQGSTESESNQGDDYIAELSREMAHYMLQDDDSRNEEEAWAAEWPKLGTKGKIENLHKNSHDDGILSKKPTTPILNFHSKQALIDEQIRTIQLHKVKQEQFMKQQQHIHIQLHQNKGRGLKGFGSGQKGMQQKHRNGSEMTAVSLGESGSKTGSCGTGVFLPRPVTNPSNSRKKPARCSTVIVPAKVVQALQFQIDRLGIEPRFNATTFLKQNGGINGQQQFEKKSQSETVPALTNQDIGLPKEWTY